MFGPGKRHDADRLAAQSGTRLLLDGGKEAVEIKIEAFDLGWPTHGMDFLRWKAILEQSRNIRFKR
jgi:hypothetical protein